MNPYHHDDAAEVATHLRDVSHHTNLGYRLTRWDRFPGCARCVTPTKPFDLRRPAPAHETLVLANGTRVVITRSRP